MSTYHRTVDTVNHPRYLPLMNDVKRAILDTSLRILATQGVDALSLREVARQAGVSHQAPYKHFPDRAHILAAIAAEGFQGLADAMQSALDGARTPRERVSAAGVAYVTWAIGHPGHFRAMFRPDIFAIAAHPEAAAEGGRAYAIVTDLAAELDLEPEVATALLWSIVHGLATLELDGPLRARARRTPEELATAVTNAVATALVRL